MEGLSLREALDHAVERLERSLDDLRAAREKGLLPHVTEDGRWELLSPLDEEGAALTGLPWTGGFVAGQLWLASRLPGRGRLAEEARAVTELIAPRAAQPTTHDLGFLFWPSAVLGYRATGDERLRRLGLEAASSLMQRVLPAGVIQVIGALDDRGYRGRVIIDTLPNLLLLWWADAEGLEGAASTAGSHFEASLRALVRPDGSTFHAGRFADDGSVTELGTINGYSRDSTWARGQAWAIHGLVSSYRATGDADLLAAAERSARWFVERLPGDGIPPGDFAAPPGPKDASAGAIVASALLDLAEADTSATEDWRVRALDLLEALVECCLNRGDADGILLHCCSRYPVRRAIDSATVWGDFFLLDALVHAIELELRLDPLQPDRRSAGIRCQLRVDEEGELPDAVRDSRRRSRVVRVRVDRNRGAPKVGKVRLARGALGVEAARRDDDELRRVREHLVPRRRKGRPACDAEHLLTSRRLDHLRQPVAGGEDGLEPLADEDATARRSVDDAAHLDQFLLHLLDDGGTPLRHAEPAGELEHARLDLGDRVCIDRDDLAVKRAQRAEIAARDRADCAEILCEDQVGIERRDQRLVDGVERPAVGKRLPDGAVDRAAVEHARVDARGRDDG